MCKFETHLSLRLLSFRDLLLRPPNSSLSAVVNKCAEFLDYWGVRWQTMKLHVPPDPSFSISMSAYLSSLPSQVSRPQSYGSRWEMTDQKRKANGAMGYCRSHLGLMRTAKNKAINLLYTGAYQGITVEWKWRKDIISGCSLTWHFLLSSEARSHIDRVIGIFQSESVFSLC